MATLIVNSILVICTGNVCRSPTGERLFKKLLPHISVHSAGTGALVNYPADTTANVVAEERGVSLAGHSAKQVTRELLRGHDLILVMEDHHLQVITKIDPTVRGKALLYGYWLENNQIPDPFRKSLESYKKVYQRLEQATIAWVNKLGQ
ncbi:protein tyrosine phosphatase [Rosenbergiella australiborealis]|uniref:arsenate reductase/protein-tyrosine-phosphatase family protein n=1 Tax=Rosenbergiella australiborealis TaxID=1544696 RepID=UPI001F4D5811|nr:protein tyrosine phosphatase [Rosenbergiella australiborealis]